LKTKQSLIMKSLKVELIKDKIPEVIEKKIQLYYFNSFILKRELLLEKYKIDSKKIVKKLRLEHQISLLKQFNTYVGIMNAYKAHKNGNKIMPIGKYIILRTIMESN